MTRPAAARLFVNVRWRVRKKATVCPEKETRDWPEIFSREKYAYRSRRFFFLHGYSYPLDRLFLEAPAWWSAGQPIDRTTPTRRRRSVSPVSFSDERSDEAAD